MGDKYRRGREDCLYVIRTILREAPSMEEAKKRIERVRALAKPKFEHD